MIPLHFGNPDRQLFGIYHPAAPGQVAADSVVLLEPFGHEAIRTQRLYRVLADRLSRAGHAVLRFSTYGAGDSGGEDTALTISGWIDDLQAAHRQLARLCGREPAVWMGARLGGTVALLAAHAGGSRVAPPRHLVLWDPILDGPAYLAYLRTQHVQALTQSYNLPDPAWARLLDPSCPTHEAIGFALSDTLQLELTGVSPAVLLSVPSSLVSLLLSPGNTAVEAWAMRQSPPPARHVLDQPFEWTSDDSLNTALVPADAMNQLMRMIHG